MIELHKKAKLESEEEIQKCIKIWNMIKLIELHYGTWFNAKSLTELQIICIYSTLINLK